MIPLPKTITPKTLAVKLSQKGERSVRKRHPWIFSDSIHKITNEGEEGDVAVIFSKDSNKVIGVGLFDPSSPIRIKMLHFGGSEKIDSSFFRNRLQMAYDLRKSLLETDTSSYRLIYGENDGFPGLIADVYDRVLVLKLYSPIWWPWLEDFVTILIENTRYEAIVLRMGRNLQKQLKEGYPKEGSIIYGKLESETILFKEHGVSFSANVIKGHKTGYFLDHRYNRKRVGELSKGKTVLDVFAYAGGFSVHALVGGAKEVLSLDISEQALQLAQSNAILNKFTGKHFTLVGDAFEELEKLISMGKTFDLVVIDPPSFAKTASEEAMALKKYKQLAHLGISLTAPKGVLVLASCSSRVRAEAFFEVNAQTLDESGRQWHLHEKTFHDADHPVSFPEGAYLKCGYYYLD